jgi:hypothetical protein
VLPFGIKSIENCAYFWLANNMTVVVGEQWHLLKLRRFVTDLDAPVGCHEGLEDFGLRQELVVDCEC